VSAREGAGGGAPRRLRRLGPAHPRARGARALLPARAAGGHRDRVGLRPGRAARAPDPQAPLVAARRDALGQDRAGWRNPRPNGRPSNPRSPSGRRSSSATPSSSRPCELAQHDRDRVGLRPGRAARAPDPQAPLVAARRDVRGVPDPAGYLALLEESEAEWAALESEITIGETFFFRYAPCLRSNGGRCGRRGAISAPRRPGRRSGPAPGSAAERLRRRRDADRRPAGPRPLGRPHPARRGARPPA
jgi:hypothetical protein